MKPAIPFYRNCDAGYILLEVRPNLSPTKRFVFVIFFYFSWILAFRDFFREARTFAVKGELPELTEIRHNFFEGRRKGDTTFRTPCRSTIHSSRPRPAPVALSVAVDLHAGCILKPAYAPYMHCSCSCSCRYRYTRSTWSKMYICTVRAL